MQNRVRDVTIPESDALIFYFDKKSKEYQIQVNNRIICFSIGSSYVDGWLIDSYDRLRPIYEYQAEEFEAFNEIEDVLKFDGCPMLNGFYLSWQEAKNVAEYLVKHYPVQCEN